MNDYPNFISIEEHRFESHHTHIAGAKLPLLHAAKVSLVKLTYRHAEFENWHSKHAVYSNWDSVLGNPNFQYITTRAFSHFSVRIFIHAYKIKQGVTTA